MQTFQAKNEPTKMCFQSVYWEIPGVPSPQQRDKRGPSQSNGHSDHKAFSHNKGIEELFGKGLLQSEVHPWFSTNHLSFYEIAQEGTRLQVGRGAAGNFSKAIANHDEPPYGTSSNS